MSGPTAPLNLPDQPSTRRLPVGGMTGHAADPITSLVVTPATDEQIAAILKELDPDAGEPWSVQCVSDVQHVVAYAANAGVPWASSASVWDISDEDSGAHFLVTIDLDPIGLWRLAGLATKVTDAFCDEPSGADAVRHVLDHVGSQIHRMLAELAAYARNLSQAA
jgi:hypothetical protein